MTQLKKQSPKQVHVHYLRDNLVVSKADLTNREQKVYKGKLTLLHPEQNKKEVKSCLTKVFLFSFPFPFQVTILDFIVHLAFKTSVRDTRTTRSI